MEKVMVFERVDDVKFMDYKNKKMVTKSDILSHAKSGTCEILIIDSVTRKDVTDEVLGKAATEYH